jgi:hypothetical protein
MVATAEPCVAVTMSLHYTNTFAFLAVYRKNIWGRVEMRMHGTRSIIRSNTDDVEAFVEELPMD